MPMRSAKGANATGRESRSLRDTANSPGALALGIRIRECFCCPELYLGENENKLIADIEHSGAEIYETTKEILIKLGLP